MILNGIEVKSTAKNLTGMSFGNLSVLFLEAKRKNGGLIWKCICDCGQEISVRSDLLLSDNKTSCGCLFQSPRHGLSGERLYRIWSNMKARCLNEKSTSYPNYGGRGISICSEWLTLEGFLSNLPEGYKENLTLDRIDFNGNYCKENCRWVDYSAQARNRRKLKTNTSGKTGVHKRGDDWVATWCEDGNLNKKYFSAKIYGADVAKQMASDFRDEMISMLNELSYGYTENHGI